VPDPFVSVADLTDMLGRDCSSAGGTIAVDAACDMCRTVSEQDFNRGTTTGTFDGTGTDALLLPQFPVNGVSAVAVVTTSGGERTWTTAGTADYAVRDDGTLLVINSAGTAEFGSEWPPGRQNVAVTYDHGYDDDDIPRDVRMVALAIAERLVLQGPALFETIGEVSRRWGVNQTDFTAGELRILRKYRRAT
jgi:hypothetical protein